MRAIPVFFSLFFTLVTAAFAQENSLRFAPLSRDAAWKDSASAERKVGPGYLFDRDMQAEDTFADALNLWYEGKGGQATAKLKTLIEDGYNDPEIYKTLLDFYNMRITAARQRGGDDGLIRESLVYGKKAVTDHPENRGLLRKYAELTRLGNKPMDFFKTLQKIIALDKNDLYANYNLGVYYYLDKKPDRARPYLNNVIANNAADGQEEQMMIYQAYYHLGVINANDLRFRDSILSFERAKSMYSRNYELSKNLALVYAAMMDYSNAVVNFRDIPQDYRTTEITEDFAGALFMSQDKSPELGEILSNNLSESTFISSIDYYLKKEYSNSIRDLERSIVYRNSSDFYCRYLLYLNYTATGDSFKAIQQAFLIGKRAKEVGNHDIAIAFFRQVEKNTNSIPDIYWLIGSIYDDKQDPTNAIAYYEKYVAAQNNDDYLVSAYVRLSYMYYKVGNVKKSSDAIMKAKNKAKGKQDIYQVYYYSGLMNVESKKYREALKDFEKAVESDGKDIYVFYFMATCLTELKDRAKAIGILEKAREREDDVPEVNNLLAYLYSMENRSLDEARKLVNLALFKDPENIAYLDTLGWIQYLTKDLENSLATFTRVLFLIDRQESKQGLDEVYYHIGMLYEALGKKAEAERYFKLAYDNNPQSEWVKDRFRKKKKF